MKVALKSKRMAEIDIFCFLSHYFCDKKEKEKEKEDTPYNRF